MGIKVQERERTGDNKRVHIDALNDDGTIRFDKWWDVSEWEADPEAIAARMAQEIEALPVVLPLIPKADAPVVSMSDAQVAAKLDEIA